MVPVTTPTQTSSPGDAWDSTDGTGVTLAQFQAWSRVATCEEGSWGNYSEGPNYFGSLGISSAAWDEFGDGIDRTSATPDQQILVAERIEGNGSVPDQNGCAGW